MKNHWKFFFFAALKKLNQNVSNQKRNIKKNNFEMAKIWLTLSSREICFFSQKRKYWPASWKTIFFFLEKILGIKKSLIDLKKRFAKVFYFCTRHESDTWRHVTQWLWRNLKGVVAGQGSVASVCQRCNDCPDAFVFFVLSHSILTCPKPITWSWSLK